MPTVHHSLLATGVISALIVFSTGCSRQPPDNTISKDIEQRISANPDTKDAAVNVATNQGKVTLTGTVKNQAAQQEVEAIARQEPGIVGVDDRTTVQPAPTLPPAPAPEAAAAPAPNSPAQSSAAVEPTPTPTPPPPKPTVIPAGTVLTVKTGQALSSKTSKEGQTFIATLAQPVKRVLPAGATVSGRVVSAKNQGKIKGEGELSVELTSISVRGHTYPIQTNTLDSDVKGKGTRTAVATGGGAAGGALIGGIAGGGKGAGVGALIGAGAGLVGGALTGNKPIELPAESALTFTLAAPLTIPPPNG